MFGNSYNTMAAKLQAKYPIVESFKSIQGEGAHVGVPMFFIRLAGCNVGRYVPPPQRTLAEMDSDSESAELLKQLHSTHAICRAFTGEEFICDTDYRKRATLSVEDLLSEAGTIRHACITGGEPFMYNLAPLVDALLDNSIVPHIETSGTHLIPMELGHKAWITCCPKFGFHVPNLAYVDELKFIVSASTPSESVARIAELDERCGGSIPIYVQPLNGVDAIDDSSVQAALAILRERPEWRLSLQLHKVLGVR